MRFMQIESVLRTKNRSEPAKNRFSVALDSFFGRTVTLLVLSCRGSNELHLPYI